MNYIKRILGTVAFILIIVSCNQTAKKLIEEKEKPSGYLLKKLHKINSKGILFGHQDDLAYGFNWKYKEGDPVSSDVKKAIGQFPAVIGWEIGHIGDSLNIDGIPFEHIQKLIIKGDSMGVVNTINWHPSFLNNSISSWDTKSDIVKTLVQDGENHQELIKKLNHFSDFLKRLKRTDGSLVPIIFRPWHEMNGNWFWWGEKYCDNKQFKELFQFTVNYLRVEKGLDNLLIAYSPDRQFHSEEEYLKWYPGDDYVDILGVDNYYDFKEGGEGIQAVIDKLEIVVNTAAKKNKLAAFTETGCDKLDNNKWYTEALFKVLNTNSLYSKLSYVLVWRNKDTSHFFVPYKEHPAFPDFVSFTNNNQVLMLDDYNTKLKEK